MFYQHELCQRNYTEGIMYNVAFITAKNIFLTAWWLLYFQMFEHMISPL